jgi:DNA-binding PadR family transcriptional regulator
MSKRLGEFEQLLLFALLRLEDDAYGITIRAEIERRTGRAPSPGAIYTALSRLEAEGLVSSRMGDATPARGGRRKKYYTIEPPGADALQRSFSALREMSDGLLPKLAKLAADETPGRGAS